VKCEKGVPSSDAEYTSVTIELIEKSLEGCENKVVWLEEIELLASPLICRFYEKNNFSPVWTSGNKLTKQAKEILAMLKDSYKY
jgi:hypothetical protein